MTAAANNDTLGELLLCLMVLLGIRRIKGMARGRFVAAAALLLGLALLTKVTAYAGVVILAAGEWGHWWLLGRKGGERLPLSAALQTIGGALLISGWWFVRNALTYGNMDMLGMARHDLVVVGQPRTVWGLAAVQHFVVVTFRSFWAQFGWMGVLVDARIYWLLALLTGIALVGLCIFLARGMRCFCPWQRLELALLALQFVLVAGVMLAYNVTFIQPQGRYLFAASAAIAIFLVLGLREAIRRPRLLAVLVGGGCLAIYIVAGGLLFLLLGGGAAALILTLDLAARRWYRPLLWGGLVAALVLLDIVCLVHFIVPALAV